MQEGILHVKLVDHPGAQSSKAEDDTNHGWLDNGVEHLVVVDVVVLREVMNHPTCVMAGKGTVRVEFVFKNPLAYHNISSKRTRNEARGLVVNERLLLISHGDPLLSVSQGAPVVRWHQ
jgi:hypothetical protein